METDSEQPLPPPKEVARKLRSLAIQTVQSWQATYGTAYKKLALGYHFLKQVKKVRHQAGAVLVSLLMLHSDPRNVCFYAVCQVDFQDVEARTVAERRREEERQQRREAMYRERVEAAAKDMEGKPSPN